MTFIISSSNIISLLVEMLGRSWGTLGGSWELLVRKLFALWTPLGCSRPLLGDPWVLLGRSGALSGCSIFVALGPLLAALGPLLAALGPLLAALGPLLSRSWPLLGALGRSRQPNMSGKPDPAVNGKRRLKTLFVL